MEVVSGILCIPLLTRFVSREADREIVRSSENPLGTR